MWIEKKHFPNQWYEQKVISKCIIPTIKAHIQNTPTSLVILVSLGLLEIRIAIEKTTFPGLAMTTEMIQISRNAQKM